MSVQISSIRRSGFVTVVVKMAMEFPICLGKVAVRVRAVDQFEVAQLTQQWFQFHQHSFELCHRQQPFVDEQDSD